MAAKKKALEDKDKAWALKKMAELFNKCKKRLYTDFILKDKTPDFDHGYEKIIDHWEDFVTYKKSEEAQLKSAINKANAAKKKCHHTMGPGGYAFSMPKWEKLEADLLAKGIVLEPIKKDGSNGQEIGFTGMGAHWTQKGSAYITEDIRIIPY